MELEKFKVICEFYGEIGDDDNESLKKIKEHCFMAIIREIDKE